MNRADRHRRPLSRTLTALAVATTLTTLATASLVGCTKASGDPADRPELRSFYGQELTWKACGDLHCAHLTVPMDYAHPDNGRTFVLPVVKAATADPSKRIGSLVYNPGGPGASGVGDLTADGGETFSRRVRDRFDIVSFDPRGVGGSKPAVKCLDVEYEEADEADEYGEYGEAEDHDGTDTPADTAADTAAESTDPMIRPRTDADRTQALANARAEAEACREGSGRILRHVGTWDAARDMDVLRAALGEAKLTYFGWSYGTYLGTSYAEQFPRRVRALTLDGAIDPSLDWSERTVSQSTGFLRAVEDYAEFCADIAGASCPGATPEEISELIDGLYEQTAREPLPVDGDGYDVDTRTLLDVVQAAMYAPEADWEALSDALRAAAEGDGTQVAELAEDAEPSGDSDGNAEEATGSQRKPRPRGADNEADAIVAVNCIDIPHPRTAKPYWDALAPADEAADLYGTSGVIGELTCKDWPAGTQSPHRVRAEGVPPVLVVGTTGDPATPYEEAESLAEQFPGGMLLTYEGLGHSAYGRSNACVTRAVDSYLIDLKPVRPGATC